MPSFETSTLIEHARAAGIRGPDDFISDARINLSVAALLAARPSASLTQHLRGKTVLLALSDQFATIAALLHLDGLARRIILWPGDRAQDDFSAIVSAAGVDSVVTTWPFPSGDVGCSSIGAVAPAPAAIPLRQVTEWILFTSGTTGQPKMVVHTLASLAGHLMNPPATSRPRAVWCSFYDIRRYGGMQIMLRALVGGGSLVLSDQTESPARFMQRAAEAGATHFLGTPSHWRRALMTNAYQLISPEYVRLSGEVADQVVLDRLRAAYPSAAIVHAFASTEAGLAFEVTDGLAGFPGELVGAGRLAELRLVDGAIRVRSARNAAGVLNGNLHKIADQDGFVETGDHVEWRDGRYHIIGRRDGIVNVGGQKVHPEEVEAVLNAHPDVQMSLVSARSNPITGAIVVADIVRKTSGEQPRAGSMASGKLEDELRAFCRSRLPPHKVPATVRLVASLAVSPSGKLVRLSA